MFIIKDPKVDFRRSANAFGKFTKRYNEDKELKSKIRQPQAELFLELIRIYIRQVGQNNKTLADANPKLRQIEIGDFPSLLTNNVELGKRKNYSAPTFWRHIDRLVEAGALIQKDVHGSMKDFEIYFNPFLVSIGEINNPAIFSKTSITSALRVAVISSCNPNTVSKGNLKNIIIPVDKESVPDKYTLQETICMEYSKLYNVKLETISGNTENMRNLDLKEVKKTEEKPNIPEYQPKNFYLEKIKSEISVAQQKKAAKIDKEPEKPTEIVAHNPDKNLTYYQKIAKKEKELKELSFSYAASLVTLFITHFFNNGCIFPKEFERTVRYVAENYFNHCNTFNSFEYVMAGYQARIEQAARYAERTPEYRVSYPRKYFDLNNDYNGFQRTKQWERNAKKWEKRKANKKNYESDQHKLQMSIRRYLARPDVSNFNTELAYIRTNLPHLQKAFFKHTKYANNQFN